MCDLNQLELAIQELPVNPEAARFILHFLEEEHLNFLKYLLQIWSKPKLSSNFMTNSITLISVCLRPTILRPFDLIKEEYYQTLSESERELIEEKISNEFKKQNVAVHELTYCFNLIIQLNKEKNEIKLREGRYLVSILNKYVIEPLQSSQSQSEKIASILLFSEMLDSQNFKVNIPRFQANAILEAIYPIFDKITDLDQNDIQLKIECAKLIAKFHDSFSPMILFNLYKTPEDKNRFLQSILPNCQIECYKLHKYLINSLTNFLIKTYNEYAKNKNLSEILPFFEKIYQETIQPVSMIKTSNYDLKRFELFSINVIKMWKKISKFECEQNEVDSSINLSSILAKSMNEFLFSFISNFINIENINNGIKDVFYYSYYCLIQFSENDPETIFSQSQQIYEKYIKDDKNSKSILISIITAQIIFNINKEIPEDFLLKLISDMIKLTQNENVSISCAAYAAIISLSVHHSNVYTDSNFFHIIIEAISNSLNNKSNLLIERALLTFKEILDPYKKTDVDSNLNKYYSFVMKMLMRVSENQELLSDLKIQLKLYESISEYISKLPSSFQNNVLLSQITLVFEQYKSLMNDHSEMSIQICSCLSIIVRGIHEKLQSEFNQFSSNFLDIFISTLEENNISNINTFALKQILISINDIQTDLTKSFSKRILNICFKIMKPSDNDEIIFAFSLVIYDLFNACKIELFDYLQDTLNFLIECLRSCDNEKYLGVILLSIVSILNIGSELDSSQKNLIVNIGEIIRPKREELMNMATKLIKKLDELNKYYPDYIEIIYCSLLDLFCAMMKIYDYEKIKENDHRILPSEFIVNYKDEYINIIQKGYSLNIYDDSVGFAFLDFVEELMNSFQKSHHMNVLIHRPCFKEYFNLTLNSTSVSLRRKANHIKQIVDAY